LEENHVIVLDKLRILGKIGKDNFTVSPLLLIAVQKKSK